MNTKYQLFYELALNLAKISFIKDEVPVGAVIFRDETYELISWSYNQMRTNKSSLEWFLPEKIVYYPFLSSCKG